ncbi:MAG: hypothetical protein AB1458_08415 [Bacteroidota bacterium]
MLKQAALFLLLVTGPVSAFAVSRAKDGAEPSCSPSESKISPILPIGIPYSLRRDSSPIAPKPDTLIKGKTISKKKIYAFQLDDEMSPASWRQTNEAFRQAEDMNADYLLIKLSDNGTSAETANKIRSKIQQTKMPVILMFDNTVQEVSKPDSIVKKKKPVSAVKTKMLNKKPSAKINPDAIGKEPDNGKVIAFNKGETREEYFTRLLAQDGAREFELVHYEDSSSGKVIDFLSQGWVCALFLFFIFTGAQVEKHHRGSGFAGFLALFLAIISLSALRSEGLAERYEIGLFASCLILLFVSAMRNWLWAWRFSLILAAMAYGLCMSSDMGQSSYYYFIMQPDLLLSLGLCLLVLILSLLASRKLLQKQLPPGALLAGIRA